VRAWMAPLGMMGVVVCGLAGAGPAPDYPASQESPGQAIFRGKGNCFSCHGPDAKGTVLAPDLTDGDWLNFPDRPTPEQVKGLVTSGVPKPKKHPAPMLPMGGARLSDAELDQVVAFVLGLSAAS
jgi:mono/diheme cytochrome c family protein